MLKDLVYKFLKKLVNFLNLTGLQETLKGKHEEVADLPFVRIAEKASVEIPQERHHHHAILLFKVSS